MYGTLMLNIVQVKLTWGNNPNRMAVLMLHPPGHPHTTGHHNIGTSHHHHHHHTPTIIERSGTTHHITTSVLSHRNYVTSLG